MRKTFLTFCAAALALLAVSSCGKLEDGLNSLKGEVADLKDRVEKLEKKLNDEVQALQATMATLATKQEMNTALANLQTSLQNRDSELATAIQTVSSTLAGLDAKYVGKSVYDAAMAELADADSDFAEALEALAALLGETEAPVDELLAELAEAIASVTVTVVENEDGNVVITLANGESFTVADPDSNANNTGLVTVDEDGNWAVILEDGTLKSLDAQVGVEELEFSVDYRTNELLYSVNGGQPVGTGAYVSSMEESVVTDFWVPEDEDFVYITIGGVEYALVKATESTSALMVKSGKAHFAYGATKVFDLNKIDLDEVYVMSKPDGWKASVDGNKLTVTAPAEGNVYAEAEGEVLLHGTDEDGKCKVATLLVSVNPGIELVINKIAGTVQLVNPIVVESEYMTPDWEYVTETIFTQVQFGIATAEEFEMYPEYRVDMMRTNWDWVVEWVLEEESPVYDAVTYPVYTSTPVSIAEVYERLNYYPLEPGQKYVVLARTMNVSYDMATGQEIEEYGDLVYAYYEPVYTDVEVLETTFNDVQVAVKYLNSDMFLIGKYQVGEYDWEEELFYFNMEYTDWNDFEGVVTEAGETETWLSEFGLGMYDEAGKLKPNTEYVVYTIPVCDKPQSEVNFEEDILPYLDTVKTAPLLPGADLEVSFAENGSTLSELNVAITASAATEVIYYNFYKPEDLENMTAEELVDALVNEGYPALGSYVNAKCPNLSENETRTIVAIAVDAEGYYNGDLVGEDFTTKSIVVNQDIVVTFGEKSEVVNGKYTVKLNVTGATKVAVKPGYNEDVANDDWFPKNVFNFGTNTYMQTSYQWANVEDGVATVTFGEIYNYSYVGVIAYNVEGNVVTEISNSFTFAYPVEPENPEPENPEPENPEPEESEIEE